MDAMRWLLVLVMISVLAAAGCGGHYGRGDADAMGDRALKEVSALIDKTVQDPEKATRAQAIVAEIVEEVKQSYRQNRQFHRRLYELNANYEAAPEDFTKILDDMNNGRMRSATKILGLRFKLKELLTAQEWKALTEEMSRARSRYRHGSDEDGKAGS
jgi:hypothetical protein